jgi:hypothetical protein
MIQRIQTVFLLIAAIAIGTLGMIPFATSSVLTSSLFADGSYSVFDSILLEVLGATSVLLILATIFLYRNRKTQIKAAYGAVLLIVVFLVMAYLSLTNAGFSVSDPSIRKGVGMLMPVIAIVCILAANRYIRKDENLVKSMDRLR